MRRRPLPPLALVCAAAGAAAGRLVADAGAATPVPATAAGAQQVLARDSAPPPYVPIVTPAPDQDAVLAGQGFRQETYYACRTVAASTHCGWHVPVVRSGGAPPPQTASTAAVALGVAGLAAVFALAMT